jgi:hypothetical protein
MKLTKYFEQKLVRRGKKKPNDPYWQRYQKLEIKKHVK